MNESTPSWKRVLLRHLQNVGRGLKTVDHVLRGRTTSRDQPMAIVLPWQTVIVMVVVAGMVYGAGMGCYAALSGERSWSQQSWQMFFSGIKVPLLVGITLVVSLPSFFVVNTLLGLRHDFAESLRAIVSAQAGLTIILVSLLPITLFFYISSLSLANGYAQAVLFNAAVFGVSSVSAQVLLRKYYRPLIERDARHRWMVRFWIFVYAFVGIQAAYILRPFIGSPRDEIAFFRNEPFENAYVVVFKMLWRLVATLHT